MNMSNMSTSKKIAIAVVVAVIVVVLWFVMKKPAANQVSDTAASAQPTATQTATSQGATVINSIPVDPAVSAVKSSGVSDDSLSKDVSAIDSQLKNFSSDTKNVSVTATTK